MPINAIILIALKRTSDFSAKIDETVSFFIKKRRSKYVKAISINS